MACCSYCCVRQRLALSGITQLDGGHRHGSFGAAGPHHNNRPEQPDPAMIAGQETNILFVSECVCLLAASRIQSSPATHTYYQTNRFYYTTRSSSQAPPSSDRDVSHLCCFSQAVICDHATAVVLLSSSVIVNLRLVSLIVPFLRLPNCWATSKRGDNHS